MTFELDDENDIVTTLKIPGTDSGINVWTRDNGHDSENDDLIGSAWDDYDEDDVEQARVWAQRKH